MDEIEEKEYEPYGDEWKKDIMKLPKAAIIDLFSKLGKKYFEDENIKICMYCEKELRYSQGIFICKECSS